MSWLIAMCLVIGASESDYYVIENIPSPDGEVIEIGGLDMLPDGALALSTRRGRVWIVENPDAENPADATWHLFADGLAEGLGLKVVDGDIHVVQRGELSRLVDIDGDRRVDRIETITQDWGLSNNYHEYAFGLPVDEQGNFYVSLNVGFMDPEWWHGQSDTPWRGWVLRVSPDGTVTPMASGLRSPCGLGMNMEGDLFATDNQGDWMPVCPIFHIEEGGFYGHPNSLRWTDEWQSRGEIPSDREPVSESRKPAAIWIPYDWSRSAGNLVPDTTAGGFGPFQEQMFVAELTNGMVLRADLEKVNGQYQGAVWPFRKGVGSVCRVRFGSDDMLYAGLTNRGWGGMEPGYGLRRIRWTGVEPMEMKRVHLLPDGFEIEFTQPLADDLEITPEDVKARTYRYNWWWEYGSPEQDKQSLEVVDLTISPDRRRLIVRTPDLEAGRCVRMGFKGIRSSDGHELLHPEFSYTVNQMPGQTSETPMIAMRVAPPLERGSEILDGWVRLTWGDPLDRVKGDGWALGAAELDVNGQFLTQPGNGLLMNDPPVSGDMDLPTGGIDGRLQFSTFLPSGGGVGVGLPSGARMVLRDHGSDPPSATIRVLDSDDTVIGEWPVEFWFGPGQWQVLSIDYETPRFNEQGRQVDQGRIAGIYLEDVAIAEAIDLPMPGGDGGSDTMRILGDVGPGGISNIRFHARERSLPRGGTSLIADQAMADAKRMGGLKQVRADGSLELSGAGVLQWGLALPDSFTVAARMRYKTGTMARLDLGNGLAIHLGHDAVSEPSTGSLPGLDEVTTHLVAAGSWFNLEASVTREDGKSSLSVMLNGVPLSSGSLLQPGNSRQAENSPMIQMQSGELEIAELRIIDTP
ncbi:MAG: hypothetical protein CMJ40_04665 [Phycisphaerae bacterium]|nr:hypothetical protein [Phycisphaerae bacterium]